MKKFMTAIALFFVFSANAQVFDGVSVSGDLPTAIAKFKFILRSIGIFFHG